MTTPNAPLARILCARGIRRVELAAAAGVGTKTVSRICRGETDAMRVETLIRVAQALDLAPADLAPRLAARHARRRQESLNV
jgi:DNA-binding Xre family transcriptional regulator